MLTVNWRTLADDDPGFANYRVFVKCVKCAADTALPLTGGEITTKIGLARPQLLPVAGRPRARRAWPRPTPKGIATEP